MSKRIIAALALWLGLGATAVQAAPDAKPCLTDDEAASLLLVTAPQGVRALSVLCATSLPPSALVRQPNGAFVGRLESEADRSWPEAINAFGKIAGDEAQMVTDPSLAKPLIAALIPGLIATKIKPHQCGQIDHILTMLAPLPPRNIANVVVSIIGLAEENDPRAQQKLPVALCGYQPR
jgi:hypothetical protein